MAYPKRTEFEKREFIAKVYNLLESKGETKKVKHLDNLVEIDKQYQVAQRYCREMGETFENVAQTPNSEFEALIAPTEETDEEEGFTEDAEEEESTKETEDSDYTEYTEVDETEEETTEKTEETDFKLNSMTAKDVQEHIHNSQSKRSKQVNPIKQKKKERKRELFGRYNEILECLQDIDDGIYRGDYNQAKRMIKTLDDYADRLNHLLDKVYVERTEKVLKQLAELESLIGKEEIMRINEGIGAYVPITE